MSETKRVSELDFCLPLCQWNSSLPTLKGIQRYSLFGQTFQQLRHSEADRLIVVLASWGTFDHQPSGGRTSVNSPWLMSKPKEVGGGGKVKTIPENLWKIPTHPQTFGLGCRCTTLLFFFRWQLLGGGWQFCFQLGLGRWSNYISARKFNTLRPCFYHTKNNRVIGWNLTRVRKGWEV